MRLICTFAYLHILTFTMQVVPGRVELPTSTLSVWRSNQLSYRTGRKLHALWMGRLAGALPGFFFLLCNIFYKTFLREVQRWWPVPCLLNHPRSCVASFGCLPFEGLQKGGVPAAPSGTATLLRLSPNYQFRPRPLLSVTDFRHPRLSWLDGRCVQGPGTYSPRHG